MIKSCRAEISVVKSPLGFANPACSVLHRSTPIPPPQPREALTVRNSLVGRNVTWHLPGKRRHVCEISITIGHSFTSDRAIAYAWHRTLLVNEPVVEHSLEVFDFGPDLPDDGLSRASLSRATSVTSLRPRSSMRHGRLSAWKPSVRAREHYPRLGRHECERQRWARAV